MMLLLQQPQDQSRKFYCCQGLLSPLSPLGNVLEMGLRLSYRYQVEGYGLISFVWEETQILYPSDLPLAGYKNEDRKQMALLRATL